MGKLLSLPSPFCTFCIWPRGGYCLLWFLSHHHVLEDFLYGGFHWDLWVQHTEMTLTVLGLLQFCPDSTLELQTRISRISSSTCPPLDHFRLMWFLKLCLFNSHLCSGLLPFQLGQQPVNGDTSSTSRCLSFPSQGLIWSLNCSAICPCQGLVTRPECVFVSYMQYLQWRGFCPVPWGRGELHCCQIHRGAKSHAHKSRSTTSPHTR